MLRKLLLILLAVLATKAAPQSRFDQRQDGGLNVKLDLDNIVVVLARPGHSSFDVLGLGGLGFFPDGRHSQQSESKEPESKSGELEDVSLDKPTEDKKQLVEEKKQPEEEEEQKMQVLVVQSGEKAAETVGEIVRAMRNLEEKKEQSRAISGKYKFVESVAEPQNLKLIGDAVENCGPGRSRDSLGICQGDRLAEE